MEEKKTNIKLLVSLYTPGVNLSETHSGWQLDSVIMANFPFVSGSIFPSNFVLLVCEKISNSGVHLGGH